MRPHSATSGGASGLEHIPTSHAACVGPAPREGISLPGSDSVCRLCSVSHGTRPTPLLSLSPEGRGRGPSDEHGRGTSGQWPRGGFHVGPRPLLRLILLCLFSVWLYPVLSCGVFLGVLGTTRPRAESFRLPLPVTDDRGHFLDTGAVSKVAKRHPMAWWEHEAPQPAAPGQSRLWGWRATGCSGALRHGGVPFVSQGSRTMSEGSRGLGGAPPGQSLAGLTMHRTADGAAEMRSFSRDEVQSEGQTWAEAGKPQAARLVRLFGEGTLQTQMIQAFDTVRDGPRSPGPTGTRNPLLLSG